MRWVETSVERWVEFWGGRRGAETWVEPESRGGWRPGGREGVETWVETRDQGG
jgi:hypothetical protein